MLLIICRQQNQCSWGWLCALCPLHPLAASTSNPVHNTSVLLPFLPNPPPPCSIRISTTDQWPASWCRGRQQAAGGLAARQAWASWHDHEQLVGRERRVGQAEGEISCSILGKYNPMWMGPQKSQGHVNGRSHTGTGNPHLHWLPFCLQYMLSQETIEALRKPTFDVWLWEPNEVRMPC